MTVPGYAAEASLYPNSNHYACSIFSASGIADSVIAQQLCRHVGQSCGGIDLICCPGLRCTARLGGRGTCVRRHLFHCSPCVDGKQVCCPPPGYGLRCFVRECGDE